MCGRVLCTVCVVLVSLADRPVGLTCLCVLGVCVCVCVRLCCCVCGVVVVVCCGLYAVMLRVWLVVRQYWLCVNVCYVCGCYCARVCVCVSGRVFVCGVCGCHVFAYVSVGMWSACVLCMGCQTSYVVGCIVCVVLCARVGLIL